jgi:hypothetical protein
MLVEPDATEPMFTAPGALIVRPAVVIANVTVVSAAEAGRAVAARMPTAAVSAKRGLCILLIRCSVDVLGKARFERLSQEISISAYRTCSP